MSLFQSFCAKRHGFVFKNKFLRQPHTTYHITPLYKHPKAKTPISSKSKKKGTSPNLLIAQQRSDRGQKKKECPCRGRYPTNLTKSNRYNILIDLKDFSDDRRTQKKGSAPVGADIQQIRTNQTDYILIDLDRFERCLRRQSDSKEMGCLRAVGSRLRLA